MRCRWDIIFLLFRYRKPVSIFHLEVFCMLFTQFSIVDCNLQRVFNIGDPSRCRMPNTQLFSEWSNFSLIDLLCKCVLFHECPICDPVTGFLVKWGPFDDACSEFPTLWFGFFHCHCDYGIHWFIFYNIWWNTIFSNTKLNHPYTTQHFYDALVLTLRRNYTFIKYILTQISSLFLLWYSHHSARTSIWKLSYIAINLSVPRSVFLKILLPHRSRLVWRPPAHCYLLIVRFTLLVVCFQPSTISSLVNYWFVVTTFITILFLPSVSTSRRIAEKI
jgi:hypothetical protein